MYNDVSLYELLTTVFFGFEHFTETDEWYQRRLAYTYSVATNGIGMTTLFAV